MFQYFLNFFPNLGGVTSPIDAHESFEKNEFQFRMLGDYLYTCYVARVCTLERGPSHSEGLDREFWGFVKYFGG